MDFADSSVDLISDLALTKHDPFDWQGKPTSLFCIVAGNVSKDLLVIKKTLEHLGGLYQGVFYIDGLLEHETATDPELRIQQIKRICQSLPNVVYMHNHVVVVNNTAFIAINGWGNDSRLFTADNTALNQDQKLDDLAYLSNTIKQLQLHQESKKIILISCCVPDEYLLYNSKTKQRGVKAELSLTLLHDTEKKVSHWLFGGSEIVADCVVNNRQYANNPRIPNQPYWPKRIAI